MKNFISFCLFTLIPSLASSPLCAATGDVLFSACGKTCVDSYAGSKTGWLRTVVSSGCVSGECLKLVTSYNSGTGLYGAGSTTLATSGINGHDEITAVYYVKLSVGSRALKGGNVKAIRPYIGGSDYIFTSMAAHFGWDHYSSWYGGLTLDPGPACEDVKDVYENKDYCTPISGGLYTCPKGRIDIKIKTSDGALGFPANKWRKVRHWMKMPTTSTSADGQAKVWIDEELVYHAYNVDRGWGDYDHFTSFSFYPSSEADEPFEHWMDEMTIYEGYVPPGNDSEQKVTIGSPSDPQIVQN